MNYTMLVDIAIALLLLWKLFQGRRQGMVRRLGRLCSLAGAILAGRFLRDRFASRLSEALLLPRVAELLHHARETLGLSDLLENLGEILEQAGLPAFIKQGVVEAIAAPAGEAEGSAVSAAAELISLRLSQWLLFLVGAVVAYLLVKLLFDGVLDPVIRRLPLVKGLNRLLGAALGLISGVLLAGVLLWLAYHMLPALSQAGGVLSAEAVAGSWLVRWYFELFPSLF